MSSTKVESAHTDVEPSFRLEFPTGSNEYRLRNNQVHFRVGHGNWHALQPADVQMHFVLATEVASWIRRVVSNPSRL